MQRPVDLVHPGEVAEIGEVDGAAHDMVEPAPAAASTAPMFSITRSAWAATSPSTSSPVAGSSEICPESQMGLRASRLELGVQRPGGGGGSATWSMRVQV